MSLPASTATARGEGRKIVETQPYSVAAAPERQERADGEDLQEQAQAEAQATPLDRSVASHRVRFVLAPVVAT